jgi:hypothetical protein
MYISLERKPSVLEAGASSTWLTVRIELVFERNVFCPSGFSRGRYAHFGPNRLI